LNLYIAYKKRREEKKMQRGLGVGTAPANQPRSSLRKTPSPPFSYL